MQTSVMAGAAKAELTAKCVLFLEWREARCTVASEFARSVVKCGDVP